MNENNLWIYDKVAAVPITAQKPINAGRLKGKTDINPMWRIKTLTDTFGPVGVGWYYIIKEKRIEEGANGERLAFLDIDLFVKVGSEWSKAIPGTGGSSFIAKETKGYYNNDECFKMALTDAISVACKALGVGADIYWSDGRTKYQKRSAEIEEWKKRYRTELINLLKRKNINVQKYAEEKGLNKETSIEQYIVLIDELEKQLQEEPTEEIPMF